MSFTDSVHSQPVHTGQTHGQAFRAGETVEAAEPTSRDMSQTALNSNPASYTQQAGLGQATHTL